MQPFCLLCQTQSQAHQSKEEKRSQGTKQERRSLHRSGTATGRVARRYCASALKDQRYGISSAKPSGSGRLPKQLGHR